MAKYEQYEEYKPTGVIWIPEMPQGWQVTKLKYLIKNLESGVSVNAADYPKSEGEFGVLKTSCVYTREFRAEENKTVFEEELSRVKCPVRAGSIIISRMNTPDLVGAAVYVKEDYSNLYLPDRLWQTVYNDEETQSSKYLHYFMYLKGFRDQISNFAEGASSSMQSIAKEDFLSINILLPTRVEQEGIANFLDYETAQIDTLIEKQQTLIQLLKEKRQAVISHAVTKGLNPDVPMKDSGVEWLGEVPEHWAVIKLANYAIPLNGDRGSNYPSGNDFVDEGVFFISTSEVVDGYVKTDTASKITLKKYNQLGGLKIKKGDIIYCLRGSVGKSGICTFDEGTISSSLMGIRSMYIDPYYLILLLTSSSELQQRLMLVTGSVSANLSAQNVMGYKFAIPEKAEQLIIIAHVKNSLERIDILLSKATQAIQLMQERRTALISAAVTGKIDVRGWQAPDNKAS